MTLTQTKINETGEMGLAFYHEDIKHRLTDADKGRYVAVDCISGEWEIGDTIESAEKASVSGSKCRCVDRATHHNCERITGVLDRAS